MNIVFHSANNSPVGQRAADGYVNATALCKAAGKRFNNWYQLDSTTEYLQALQVDTGIPVTELVQIRKGGKPSEQGTWVHPEVAVDLAHWLSPQFRIMVNRWVMQWMITGQNPVSPQHPTTPPPRSTPALPPAPLMSAELSPDSELYQLLKEVGEREVVRRFFS